MGEVTLSQAFEEFSSIHLPSRNFAQRTRVEYRNDIEDLVRYLESVGKKNVLEITIRELEGYLAELDRRKIAGSTRKRKVISIRSFLSFLYQFNYMRINLANRIIPPYVEPRTPRFLTESEYKRLVDHAAQNKRDFAMIQIFLQTGIKLSELTRLTVNDIKIPPYPLSDLKELGFLNINGGARMKERTIPLNYHACQALELYLNCRPKASTSVLFLNQCGKPLSARGVEKIIQKYYTKTGIEDATVQSLRHTFGVHHAAKGTSLKTLQTILGHKDIRTTSLYTLLAQNVVTKELLDHAL